jgi:hypothetical protein
MNGCLSTILLILLQSTLRERNEKKYDKKTQISRGEPKSTFQEEKPGIPPLV